MAEKENDLLFPSRLGTPLEPDDVRRSRGRSPVTRSAAATARESQHQLLVHVVLHVGHRVGKDANMQWVPCSPPMSSQICAKRSRAASR
jgi:hypothetical protein